MNKAVLTLLLMVYAPTILALDLKGYSQFASIHEMNFATAGIIKMIHVKPGDTVQQGTVLMELEATAHQARLEQAQAIEKSLQPEVTVAELEFERAQELYDRDSLSQVELQNAENRLIRAQGNHDAASARVRVMEYDLANTRILAPIDARVISVQATPGQYIDPAVDNRVLITIANDKRMLAVSSVNSDQWNTKWLNKSATVSYRGKKYNGEVKLVGFQRVEQSSKLRSYELQVEFESDIAIPEEMPLSISIRD